MEKNKTSGNPVNPVDDPCDDVVHWLQEINESLKTKKETKDDKEEY